MSLRQRPGTGNPKDKGKGKNKKGREDDSTQPRVIYVRPKCECVLVLYTVFLWHFCKWLCA